MGDPNTEIATGAIRLEKLQNTQAHLDVITSYVKSHPDQFGSINPFTYTTDSSGNADITITTPEGDRNLAEFLPKEVTIVNNPEAGGGAYALISWDLEGNLTNSGVNVDLAWMKERPALGASIVAHEIGHAINEVAKEDIDQKKITENPKTSEELEQSLMTVCRIINDGLQDEVEAWNYGKPIADLFGIDETTYDNQMEYSMKGYSNASYRQIDEMLSNMLMHLTPTQKETLKDKTFPIYDLATQDRINLTIEQMRERFEMFTQERVETSGGSLKA